MTHNGNHIRFSTVIYGIAVGLVSLWFVYITKAVHDLELFVAQGHPVTNLERDVIVRQREMGKDVERLALMLHERQVEDRRLQVQIDRLEAVERGLGEPKGYPGD